MKLRKFIDPTKSKIVLTIVVAIIGTISLYMIDMLPSALRPVFNSIGKTLLYPSGWIVSFSQRADVQSCIESCRQFGLEYGDGLCDCIPQSSANINPVVAIILGIIIALVYWYLISCVIAEIVSFTKKKKIS